MDKVKIGAIGVGGMASGPHEEFDGIRRCRICRHVRHLGGGGPNDASQKYGGTPYTDYKEMYDKEVLDAVYICTPPFVHGEQELIACEKRIPFFIEKPVGTCRDVAQRFMKPYKAAELLPASAIIGVIRVTRAKQKPLSKAQA